jgi:hypothetical protein
VHNISGEKMKEIEKEIEYVEGGNYKRFKCTACNTVLGEIFEASISYQLLYVRDCPHFKWVAIGNGCYPEILDPSLCEGTKEIAEKAILVLRDGTTYYFLVPQS